MNSELRHMNDKKFRLEHKKIPPLAFPNELLPILSTFNDKMLGSLERDGPPIEDGGINLGKLNDDELFTYTVFLWVSEISEVIDNLNLILDDFSQLAESHVLFRGSPKKRYYLLIRVYFHEFYRSREIFSQVLHALKSQGRTTKEEIRFIRETFHDAFAETIEMRNNIVHGSPNWVGKEHYDLNLVGGAWDSGHALADKDTGEIWSLQEVLFNACKKQMPVLYAEGERMRNVMQRIIDDVTEILRRK